MLARLPLTRDFDAWSCDAESWSRRTWDAPYADGSGGEGHLMAYSDLASMWSHGDSVEGLDPFAKLLLAGCRGGDDPRLLA